jgi:hypothetical protein
LRCHAFVMHLLTFLQFLPFVVSVRPLQSFDCEGGGGDGGGGDGGSGGGSTQQAFLQFLESSAFLHRFIHFFSISSTPHDLVTLFRSFFLHFVSSATQSFSDVAAAVLFVSSADSVFKLSTGVVVTAPTQFSMQKAASSLGRNVPFILASVAFFIWWERGKVRVRVGLKEGLLARAIGSGSGSGFWPDVCQGGGDKIVTLSAWPVFSSGGREVG